MRIGVIGLGTMGAPMARHLLDAGHQVTVHNRTRERELPLAELGATRCESPAAAARDADAVLTCVSDSPDLEQVIFGPGGYRRDDPARRDRGRLLDRLTRCHRSAGGTAGRAGRRYGGRARLRRLRRSRARHPDVFAGGDPDHVQRATPLLEAFSGRITHLGPPGAGQLGKAVNQVMIAGTYAGVAEGIALAEKAGLPLDELVEALSGGAAGSWVLTNRSGNMIRDNYPLGFKLALHRKDLGIALDEAGRVGLELDISKLVAGQEDALIDEGFGDEDVSALARAAKRRPASPSD